MASTPFESDNKSTQSSVSRSVSPTAPILQPQPTPYHNVSPYQLYNTIQYPTNINEITIPHCMHCNIECTDINKYSVLGCCHQYICLKCTLTYTHQHTCIAQKLTAAAIIQSPIHISAVHTPNITPVTTPNKIYPIQSINMRWPMLQILNIPRHVVNNSIGGSVSHTPSSNMSNGYRTPTMLPMPQTLRSASDSINWNTPIQLLSSNSPSPNIFLKLTPPDSRAMSPQKLFTDTVDTHTDTLTSNNRPIFVPSVPMTPNNTSTDTDYSVASISLSPNKMSLSNTLCMMKQGFFVRPSKSDITDLSTSMESEDIDVTSVKRKRKAHYSDDEVIHSSTDQCYMNGIHDTFMCPLCDKVFSKLSAVKRHQRCHTGERPYKCTECDLSFAENGNLKRHMKIHSGDKPFQCERCGKKFARRCHLLQHERAKQRATACANLREEADADYVA